MNIPFRIQNSTVVTLFGREGRIISTDGQGYVFEGSKTSGQTERLTLEDFDRLIGTPDLCIEPERGAIGARSIEAGHGKRALFAYAPYREQVRALWKKACCDAFLALYHEGRIRRTDADINANIAVLKRAADVRFGITYYEAHVRAGGDVPNKKFPCARTFREYLKNYEEGGLVTDALISKNHNSGNRSARFSVDEMALMMRVVDAYASTQKPTMKEAVRQTRDHFYTENKSREAASAPLLKVPSKVKVWSILAAQSAFHLKVRRDGIGAAERSFAFKSKGVQAEYPLERVEVDENKLDIISFCATSGLLDVLPPERIKELEKTRRWLYLYMDCATKCVLSLHLAESQGGDDAARSLRDVFRDKTDRAEAFGCKHSWEMRGRPFQVVADHGTAFHSNVFQSAAASLGIGVEHPPLGKAHLRGHVESIFKTNNHLLMSHIIGRTFSNTRERGDYPSKDLANLSDDELIGLIITVIVDIYHHRPHEALNGYTPAQRWAQLAQAGTVPVPPDGHEIRAAIGWETERSVNNGGINVFRIQYACPELRDAYLHRPGQKVKVRVDFENLGWVTVELKGKRFAARATWDVFDGMSHKEWEATRREILKRKSQNEAINQQTVIDAYARIDDTVRRSMLRTGVTPFHATDADVERTEHAMWLTLRDDRPSDDTPLTDLINPPVQSTNPLERGEVINPRGKDEPRQSPETPQGRTWEFDDE